MTVDGLGNPLRILLLEGQLHETRCARTAVAGLGAQKVLADSAYDSDSFREWLAEQGSTAVIPSNPSRSQAIRTDWHVYKERHLVECFINKIKQFRRVATRYDKTARSFWAFLALASTMVWLR